METLPIGKLTLNSMHVALVRAGGVRKNNRRVYKKEKSWEKRDAFNFVEGNSRIM